MTAIKRIYISPGYMTVWKRGKGGTLKPVVVPRKGYFITRKVKAKTKKRS